MARPVFEELCFHWRSFKFNARASHAFSVKGFCRLLSVRQRLQVDMKFESVEGFGV